MHFRLNHTTEYRYAQPASESIGELRLWPQDGPGQRILSRRLVLQPEAPVSAYCDYFGNQVEVFHLPFRHASLRVTAEAEVETFTGPDLSLPLAVSCAEARQILHGLPPRAREWTLPTALVPTEGILARVRQRFFVPARPLGEALRALNSWIFSQFTYRPGVTDVTTPVRTLLDRRQGVCQDFAHLMLAILRAHGFPARYVSGYIEALDPTRPGGSGLIGAAASHAWVEVLLPGGHWWGLDPTNNQPAGERHIRIATGRDYNDAAPLRGTFKGASNQRLQVIVNLRRRAAVARR